MLQTSNDISFENLKHSVNVLLNVLENSNISFNPNVIYQPSNNALKQFRFPMLLEFAFPTPFQKSF